MIDFLINNLMMPLLRFFYDISGSYGWAIIFVTVAVKSALMPLTFKSIKAQMDMQRIQPIMKELQAKYKDRPELLNQEMIKLYKDHRVNPLGGCLPILVQLPFFIAIYSTFVSEEFNKLAGGSNSSFFFIQDLTKKGLTPDNIFLVVIFGITTFVSQKMMTTNPDDPMQKQMLYIMPIMITVMFFTVPVPSAALLYIVASNLFSMLQNFFVLKEKKRLGEINGTNVVEKNAKDILSSKISLEKNNSSIMLEKEIITSNLSPVMSSSSKSKRVKKDQKKNRKK